MTFTQTQIDKMIARQARFTNKEYATNQFNEIITEFSYSDVVVLMSLEKFGFISHYTALKMHEALKVAA